MVIVFAILLFSLLIFVHEFGHFITAKLCGVQVNEFAIFMGPPIVKWKRGETQYSIRCIPIGGYCAMEGEDEVTDNPRAFTRAKWWKRLIILIAGSAMNFIAGLVLLFCVVSAVPQYATTDVEFVEPASSLAEGNGIQTGDRLLEIDGEKLYVQSDFSLILAVKGGLTHDVLVERDGEKVLLDDVLFEGRQFDNGDGTTSLRYGITFSVEDATFGKKLGYTWNCALDYVRIVRLSIGMLLKGDAGISDMSGPVGIVQQMSATASASESVMDALYRMLDFGAMIAINLAVMNLLPVPALDGGRAVCLLLTAAVEGITKKKINPKYEGYLHAAGMILLLGFMAIITLKDIFGLFR